MPRWSFFLLFFAVAALVLGGVHYYFYRRLVLAPRLPGPWRKVAGVVVVALALSFPLSFFASRVLDIGVARVLVYPIYIWLGMMLMLFTLLAGIDLVYGLARLGARLTGHHGLVADPGRRLFLARSIAGAATGTVLVATGAAVWQGLTRLVVKPVEVVLPNLPAALDGFRIAQLTDIHLGTMRGGDWFDEVVARTNALGADLIAITGDLADAHPKQIPHEVATLGKLSAPHGVFFVTGNHEYFIDLEAWLNTIGDLGIRVLRNECVAIEQEGAAFDLLGVDDHEGRRFLGGHGTDVPKAVQGRDPQRASVLLAHQPRVIEEASANDVGLVLSGHTHGGQIWPWSYMVYLQQPYVRGLHDHSGTQIYISEGTGFWGPPMRLGSTAEIALITLRAPRHEA